MSTDLNPKKPERTEPWSAGQADDVIPLSEETAAPAVPAAGGERPVWYVAKPSGEREGPFPLAVLQRRLATGGLTPRELVWRDGMAAWAPAGSIPELARALPGQPPPVMPSEPRGPRPDPLQQISAVFANPAVYRWTGWVCAGLTIVALFVWFVLLLVADKVNQTPFVTVLVLAALFVVCEAAAAILEKLGQIESRLPQREGPGGQ